MKERVYTVLSQVLGIPESQITDDSSPDTIQSWDSLKHMNLILALEEEFGVHFTDQQIVELLNVSLIIMTLQELLS